MSDPLARYIEAATGLTKTTRDTAEKVVRSLVEQGQTAASDPQQLVEQLVERSQANRQALIGIVRSETKRAVKRMGLATQADLERLQRQVGDLRRELREAEGGGGTHEGSAAGSDGDTATGTEEDGS